MLTSAQSRGWHGIVPLRSTRADVERIMGVPTERSSQYTDFYRTSKETVLIRYATGSPCGIGEKYSRWRVPRDTVESILVTPTEPLRLLDLGIDETKYEKQQGGHRRDDVYYVNKQTGETIVVFMNEVTSLTYSSGASDEDLQCPGQPKELSIKCDGTTPHRFSFYGDVSSEREKALLDNFAIALNDEPNRTGYIIAYAGKRARAREAKARAQQAKEYLVKVRNYDPKRLKTIDGGYREEAEIELFIVSDGMCPPFATPTIDPRDVKIVKGTGSQQRRG
jgi:hypothetical protein